MDVLFHIRPVDRHIHLRVRAAHTHIHPRIPRPGMEGICGNARDIIDAVGSIWHLADAVRAVSHLPLHFKESTATAAKQGKGSAVAAP